jgi:iron complex outermembrane receptor protein
VSSALRTPNYFEEKFNTGIVLPTTVPNVSYLFQYYADQGNLKPERIISKEIGYLGDFGALSLDARMFHDDVHDYIRDKLRTGYTPPSGFILIGKPDGSLKVPKSFENAGDVAVKGFEAQAKWHINNDTRLLLNYAYVKIDADEKQTATNITMSMPRDTISALLTHRFNSQWDVSLAYYQTSEVAALGDGNLVGLARRADVRLARKFSLEHVHGEVSAVVENLFNEHYQEFADYNTLKRRARINVKLDF